MCGVIAAFAYGAQSPPIDLERMRRARDTMQSRGPDGAGLWTSTDARVALAHRRLSIIDLSENGSQPMTSADGMLCITFNGEIYNYRELRAELEHQGFRFRSDSDTEVLLHLYAVAGHGMLHKLRGMFAFAIWDAANGELFAARDPFGIKPLYYADTGETLWIASQVKTLLDLPAIDTRPDPADYAGFFLWGSVPEPFTTYRGIRALPEGYSQVMDPASAQEGWENLRTLAALKQTIPDGASSHLAVSALELSWYMRNQLLRDADWAGMAHSLEIRVPLVDVNVFRAWATVAARYPQLNKRDLAATPAKPLPSEIIHRPKTGFSVPVRNWIGGKGVAERSLRGWARMVARRVAPAEHGAFLEEASA